MKGQEILGSTAAELIDDLEKDESDDHEIIEAFVVAIVHVTDETEHGSSYMHYKCSNASWIFQLGVVHGLVESQQARRGNWQKWDEREDEDEDDGDS